MTFAATVSSYQLVDFVELNVLALRRVFGDIPILISDDWSDKSVEIRDLATRLGTHHLCSDSHRGHFAGDACSCCNALAFAEAEGADVCVKVSQRFVLCAPAAREILERYFADPEIHLVLPGRVAPGTIKRAESRFFSNLSTQSDLVCVRTGKLRPNTLKELYESRVRAKQSRHDSLIEALWGFIMDVTLAGHASQAPEFTHPYPGRPPIYLRRCQAEPAHYQALAQELGMTSFNVLLQEWRALAGQLYRPVPCFNS